MKPKKKDIEKELAAEGIYHFTRLVISLAVAAILFLRVIGVI